MVLGALVDAGQVADEDDGPAGVLVVAAGEPVPVQHVQDVGEQVQAYPVVASCAPPPAMAAARGRMSGATPVPVAGFQPYRGR